MMAFVTKRIEFIIPEPRIIGTTDGNLVVHMDSRRGEPCLFALRPLAGANRVLPQKLLSKAEPALSPVTAPVTIKPPLVPVLT